MATSERDEARAANGAAIGTAVPNRIFVGGISSKTNEEDLRNLFSKYGCVKATKIIVDKTGTSKGYGFVTFETEEEAQKVLLEVECLTLKDRKLNVAPAVKKHPFNRNLDSGSLQTAPVVWAPSYPSREPVYYPQAPWPFVWQQQQLYLPQQCAYPQAQQPGCPQLIYSVASPDYAYQNIGQASDFSETSSADSGEYPLVSSGKIRSRTSPPAPTTEHERSRSVQTKAYHAPSVCIPKYNGCVENPNAYSHASPVPPMHHVLAKTVNGVTVMAYPTPYLMGSPTIVHMKDDSEAMLSDMGYIHSPIATGALTPPPTPMASLSCDFSINAGMESSRKN